jgi:hypothetical protein
MKVTFCGPFAMSLFKGGADLRAMKTAQKLKERGIEVEFLSPYTTELGAALAYFHLTKRAIYPSLFCLGNNHKFWHFSQGGR